MEQKTKLIKLRPNSCNTCIFCEKHHYPPHIAQGYCLLPRKLREGHGSKLDMNEFGIVKTPEWCPLKKHVISITLAKEEDKAKLINHELIDPQLL